ncbi:MAG TPA: hypothetical protein VGA00_07860 [Acidiferrobacterales bacterium]|jgi:hypothetical protein
MTPNLAIVASQRAGRGQRIAAATPPAGTFNKHVMLSAEPGSWGLPFTPLADGCRMQMLVRAADIQGAGPIQALTLYLGEPTASVVCERLQLRLAHSTLAALGTDLAANLAAATAQTVLATARHVLPAGARGDTLRFEFDRPYHYNGVDNLVIDLDAGPCSRPVSILAASARPAYPAAVIATRGEGGLPPCTDLPRLSLRFGGGVSTLSRERNPVSEFVPFNDFSQLRHVQVMYPAEEVNGAGRITGIALRVAQDSRLEQRFRFNLCIGHSRRDELSDVLAANFDTGPAVMLADDAWLRVPENLAAGEYLWLPLHDGSFVYNGVDNLLLDIEVAEASGTLRWSAHLAGGRRRRAFGLPGAATTEHLDSGAYDLRLAFAARAITV